MHFGRKRKKAVCTFKLAEIWRCAAIPIIGIFDLDNASYSKHTRKFLQDAEENGSVISVSDELPKAFILTQEYGIDHV